MPKRIRSAAIQISLLFFTGGLVVLPATAAVLGEELRKATGQAAKFERLPDEDRERMLLLVTLKVIAELQQKSDRPLVLDAGDRRAWVAQLIKGGAYFIGGRVGRQAEKTDRDFILRLDDYERRSWAMADEFFTDDDRAALVRAYPGLARAVYQTRRGARSAMVLSHLMSTNFSFAKTSAAFGRGATTLGAAAMVLKLKVGAMFHSVDRIGEEMLLAQVLIALARYLKIPAQNGFCADRLTTIEPSNNLLPRRG